MKAPTVEDTLDAPSRPPVGRKIAKNLHIVVPGIVVTALAFVLLTDARQEDAADEAAVSARIGESLRAQNRVETQPPPDLIAEQIRQQRQAAENEQREVELAQIEAERLTEEQGQSPSRGGLLDAPPAPNTKVDLPPLPRGSASQGQATPVSERDAQIRSAPILGLTGPGAAQAQQARADRVTEAIERDLAAARRDAERTREDLLLDVQRRMGATEGVTLQDARTGADEAWLDQYAKQSSAVEPIRLDQPTLGPVIHQGAIIPAVLITEIQSSLPGQISAQVSMDVYDTIDGRELLIPRGSRLVGSYSTNIRPGQERVLIAFERLIRPDGSSINIGGMPGSDQMGRAGVHDEVHTYFWKRFRAAFMVAGLSWLADRGDSGSPVPSGGDSSSPISATGAILRDIGQQTLERETQIQPALVIRKGYKFNVLVNRDIQIPSFARMQNTKNRP